MPRPKTCRCIERIPNATYFKPRGIPMHELQEQVLPFEGLEALRLADIEGLTAAQAAERMHVSRHTFGRTLSAARRVVAEALVHGQALCITGGDYKVLPATPCKQESAMRIAISSEGPTLDDMVDPRFGRAGGFVLVDPATMDVEYMDNGAAQTLAHGAGIETAERMSAAGVGVVLSGYVGPKAFEALSAADIKVCQDLDGMSVREAVLAYTNGKTSFAEGPNR